MVNIRSVADETSFRRTQFHCHLETNWPNWWYKILGFNLSSPAIAIWNVLYSNQKERPWVEMVRNCLFTTSMKRVSVKPLCGSCGNSLSKLFHFTGKIWNVIYAFECYFKVSIRQTQVSKLSILSEKPECYFKKNILANIVIQVGHG